MKTHGVLFSAPMVRAILEGRKTQTRRVANLARAVGEPDVPPGHVLDLIYPGSVQHYGDVTEDDDRRAWRVQRLCDATCAHRDDTGPYDGRHSKAWGPMPYAPGDRLWVRETWQVATGRVVSDLGAAVRYRDAEIKACWMPTDKRLPLGLTWDKWRPSIFMPRWASRITLEVTAVRLEPLQDISEDDARAEGVDDIVAKVPTARDAFRLLWDDINGKPRPVLDDDGTRVLDDDDRPIMEASRSWASNLWVWAVSFRKIEVSNG